MCLEIKKRFYYVLPVNKKIMHTYLYLLLIYQQYTYKLKQNFYESQTY